MHIRGFVSSKNIKLNKPMKYATFVMLLGVVVLLLKLFFLFPNIYSLKVLNEIKWSS